MNFDVLLCLAEIAKAGNLTEAAEALHISQSALSHMVKGLEDELGKPLFERKSGKALRLNTDGRLFVDSAQQILKRYQESGAAIQQAGITKGPIHIGIQNENDGLIYLLSMLRKRHPQITFHLHSMRGSLESYLNSDMDFYVLPANMKGDLPHLAIASISSVYALVSDKHPLSKRRVLHLEDLRGERLAFATEDKGKLEATYQYCLDAGINPNVVFLYDDVSYQLELVQQAGIVVITHNTFRQFRSNLKGIVEIPIDYGDPYHEQIFLTWQQHPANPLARYLINDILQTYPQGVIRIA